jgi:group II intron reverse transcriptase/maturase
MGVTPRAQTIQTKLRPIAEQAVNYPNMIFTTLAHRIDVELLTQAYHMTRKDGAPGLDKVTAGEYTENLEENLKALHMRLKAGLYVAPPVERRWIEKENGKLRPIGVPTFEDKIVQRAVTMVLNAIYENDFYNFSHGFRPGHSQHQALHELREQCRTLNINWIVDADVSGFFDNLDHGHLRDFIKQRINDGAILRLIGKWLNAGVMEDESLTYPEKGTPQGGVISPLLGNIYLHHVLDDWFVKEVYPRMKGRCFITRFADDFIVGFELEDDARRFMKVLPKRFAKYGLTVNPEKTKLVDFRKPSCHDSKAGGKGTFVFLGFTHYWGRTRKGYWVIKRKTSKKSLKRFMREVWEWCRNHRHDPLKEQYRILCSKLRGFYYYFGVRCNYDSLDAVYVKAWKAWRYWLSRRSHKSGINWEKFVSSIKLKWPLPKPKIIHNI